jgi:hypothetical protein
VLAAVELALEAGVPTKTHNLNLLHRLIDGKPIDPPVVKPPNALTLTSEPQANVERYDAPTPGQISTALYHHSSMGVVLSLHPPHAAKTLQSHIMFADRL